tara:strand:- start:4338 stop:4547 length:210 start_codon:yes stop_codon:yes gene_type:complete
MYDVTDIEFDFCEFGDGIPECQLTFDEEIAIRDSALGVYEADNEDDLREEIIASSGFYPIKFNYHIQLK